MKIFNHSAKILILLMMNYINTASAETDLGIEAQLIIDSASISIERIKKEHQDSDKLKSALNNARGVLIIPSYYKAGLILGGSYGDGVLLKRQLTGFFSDPAFYRMTSGSIGLQMGIQSSSIIFIILTNRGMQAILDDNFKIGANVGISVGALGAGKEAAVTTNIGKDIVAYAKNAGLFAGGSLEGSLIKPRKDWNAAVYGLDKAEPESIISRSELIYAEKLKGALMEYSQQK